MNIHDLRSTGSLTLPSYSLDPRGGGGGGGSIWTTGGATIIAKSGGAGFGDSQNAAASATGGPGTDNQCTEEYNGTSWAAGGSMIIGRIFSSAAGTQNAGLVGGGYQLTPGGGVICTEEYNGTSWTAGGNMINARYNQISTGTQNEGLIAGGYVAPAASLATEEYNGTTWASGGNLINTNPKSAAGTQNAALSIAGGSDNTNNICNEEYNGTSWSAGGSLIYPKNSFSHAGIQNSTLITGGQVNLGNSAFVTISSEIYDGTSWSYTANKVLYANGAVGAGAGTANISFNGFIGPNAVTCTEEYTNSGQSLVSAWSSLSGLITARDSLMSGGNADRIIAVGGYNGAGSISNSELYDGTTWSTLSNLIKSRYWSGFSGANEYDFSVFGGQSGSGAVIDISNSEYTNDGFTWVSFTSLPTIVSSNAGAGLDFNSLLSIGSGAAPSNITNEYNGLAWSTGGNLISGRQGLTGTGRQNSALVAGGITTASPTPLACTEEYNGTSWSTGGALITARESPALSGIQNAALVYGGGNTSPTPAVVYSCTEEYNGTSWASKTGMITSRMYLSGGGVGGNFTDTVAVGGANSSLTGLSCVEKYAINSSGGGGGGGTIYIPSGSIGSIWLDTSVRCLKFIRLSGGNYLTGSINAV